MAEQTKIKGFPVFRATLSPDVDGMQKISLVTDPAVISHFVAFAGIKDPEQAPRQQRFSVQDEEQHRVLGVVMRANCPIIRFDERIGYYFIYYDAETIKAMAEQYLRDGRQNAVNLQHEDGTDTDAVHLVQWFIKDEGINPAGFEDIEAGSLFAEFHVTDEDIWQQVKDGTFQGFSLEGIFGMEAATEELSTEKIALSQNTNNMNSKIERLKQSIIACFEAAEQAGEAPATEQNFGSVSTDNGILRWEGDEPLKEGDAVKLVDEDGNESDAADGIYKTETHSITVADGKVSEIEDIDNDDTVQDEEKKEQSPFAAMAAKLSASFDDKYHAIYKALADKGVDGYILEAGDDFAIVEVYTEDGYKYFRYGVSFSEDGYECTLGEGAEVFPTWVTAEERAELEGKAAEQAAALEAAQQEMAAVKAELAALKGAPAAEPAHEQFKAAEAQPQGKAGRIYSILR